MSKFRLYMAVEGQTEFQFVKESLTPHLEQFQVTVMPPCIVGTNQFTNWRKDLDKLMRTDTHPNVWFTTMVDLYRLKNDFPAWAQAQKAPLGIQKVQILEQAWHQERGLHPRFIPYIQLHEFESLLYCDLSQVAQRLLGYEKKFAALEREVAGFAPEEINHSEQTGPSKRLIRHVPAYKSAKVRVGVPAAVAIGLPKIRAMCPHFNDWLTKLERIGKGSG